MLLTYKDKITVVWYRTGVEASFASRRLLSPAVKEYCTLLGVAEKDVSFTSAGKPYFTDFEGHYLSVTHSADMLLFAFAPFPLGVDAERKGESRPKVASRYFTPEEMEADFAHVWTGREAVGKLTGVGLTDALRTEISGDTATLDGKKYVLSRTEVEEFLVTFATEECL